MILRLTEAHHHRESDWIVGTFCTTTFPGLISENYARKIFGREFDRAIKYGVLVYVEPLNLTEEEMCLKYAL